MQAQTHFHLATAFFYENKYQEALQSINTFIKLKINNTMAYNNRALIYYKMNQLDLSREDMLFSLQISPNSYISYFNLFSIEYMEGNISSALDNIQCCLSSLNMICGRIKKDKDMVGRSLEICHDNIEALILLIIMEINEGRYAQAFLLMEKYHKKTNNEKVMKLYNHLQHMNRSYTVQLQEQLYQILEETDFQKERLSSSHKTKEILEQQYESLLKQKLSEFNSLYNLLNKLLNKKVQAIPLKECQKDDKNEIIIQEKKAYNNKVINNLTLMVAN